VIYKIPALRIESLEFAIIGGAHKNALASLIEFRISEIAVHRGLGLIKNLPTSMRGEMILDAISSNRRDSLGKRGTRFSHMDCEHESEFLQFLNQNGVNDVKIRETIALASKTAHTTNYVAELCSSDDRNYVTSYIAFRKIYRRISPMKLKASNIGSRIFFFKPIVDLEALINIFERQSVLAAIP
jgi:6-carboxyhexanoate--CoA ligase